MLGATGDIMIKLIRIVSCLLCFLYLAVPRRYISSWPEYGVFSYYAYLLLCFLLSVRRYSFIAGSKVFSLVATLCVSIPFCAFLYEIIRSQFLPESLLEFGLTIALLLLSLLLPIVIWHEWRTTNPPPRGAEGSIGSEESNP